MGVIMNKSTLVTILTVAVSTVLLTVSGNTITYADTESKEEDTEIILPDENAPIFSDEGAAYLDVSEINLDNDSNFYSEESKVNGRVAQYRMWRIESKTSGGASYGSWRNGPSGKGKATLNCTNSNTSNRSVSSSISGSSPVGANKIGASLGITIGQSKTYSVGYSIEIPAGKRRQIIFRPVYKLTNVKQREYVAGVKTSNIKTATVKTFSHWDYSYRNL